MLIEFTLEIYGEAKAEVSAEVSADYDGIAVIEKAEFYTLKKGIRAPSNTILKLLKKIPHAWENLIDQATAAMEKRRHEINMDYHCY
jgi:hypothetical protein